MEEWQRLNVIKRMAHGGARQKTAFWSIFEYASTEQQQKKLVHLKEKFMSMFRRTTPFEICSCSIKKKKPLILNNIQLNSGRMKKSIHPHSTIWGFMIYRKTEGDCTRDSLWWMSENDTFHRNEMHTQGHNQMSKVKGIMAYDAAHECVTMHQPNKMKTKITTRPWTKQ